MQLLLACQQRPISDLQDDVQRPVDSSEPAGSSLPSSSSVSFNLASDQNEVTALTPRELVKHLDRNIVGQVGSPYCFKAIETFSGLYATCCFCSDHKSSGLLFLSIGLPHTIKSDRDSLMWQEDAKKAVANALRNRWRRSRIKGPLKVISAPLNSEMQYLYREKGKISSENYH